MLISRSIQRLFAHTFEAESRVLPLILRRVGLRLNERMISAEVTQRALLPADSKPFGPALDISPFIRLYSALCSGDRHTAFVTLPSPVRGVASASPRRLRQCPRPGSLRNVLYAMKRISTFLPKFIKAKFR
jgi:hypothetical protein